MNTRPNRNDPQVVKAAVAKLLPSVLDWCQQTDGELDDQGIEELRRNLEMELASERDGYRLARSLDQYTLVEPDAVLVEILDRAHAHVRAAHFDAVKAWVKELALTSPFFIGDKVSVPCRYCSGRRPPPGVSAYTGEVASIDADTAVMLVVIPELGHVREGLGTHGVFIPYEYATKI